MNGKMGIKKNKELPPFFALRFSACSRYSQRFTDIVSAAIVKYPSLAINKKEIFLMEKSSENDYQKIRARIYRIARPIELASWQYRFEDGRIEDFLNP